MNVGRHPPLSRCSSPRDDAPPNCGSEARPMKRMSTRIAAVTVAAALGLGGCGKDQPPVCDSLAAAQTTMVQIRNANVSENGLGPLKTSLQELKGDIDVLITDAKTQ